LADRNKRKMDQHPWGNPRKNEKRQRDHNAAPNTPEERESRAEWGGRWTGIYSYGRLTRDPSKQVVCVNTSRKKKKSKRGVQ